MVWEIYEDVAVKRKVKKRKFPDIEDNYFLTQQQLIITARGCFSKARLRGGWQMQELAGKF